GVALMVVAVRLAERFGGRPAGILAAVGMALSPTIVFVAGALYPPTPPQLLPVSFPPAARVRAPPPPLARAASLGAQLALGWLTDQVFLAPALAVGGWLVWRRQRPLAPYVRALAAAGIAAFVIALPYVRLLQRAGGDGVFMRKAQTVLYTARTD